MIYYVSSGMIKLFVYLATDLFWHHGTQSMWAILGLLEDFQSRKVC